MILSTPGLLPLLKVLAAFAAMLVGVRLRLGLGPSILAGAALVGLFFGTPPLAWLKAAALALADPETLFLTGIVGLILILSDLMERTGQTRRLMTGLSERLTSPRLRLAIFPALVGFLPMPGGAIFSAPMVAEISEPMGLRSEQKVLLNYWFRHLWEMAWPLYPGIILTSNLAGMPITTFMAYNAPGPLLCMALGWWFFLRPGRLPLPAAAPRTSAPSMSRADLLRQGLPLMVAIVGSLVLESLLSALAPGLPFELGVVTALAAAVLCVTIQNGAGPRLVFAALTKKSFLSMVVIIASIYVFKNELEAAGAVEQMARLAGGPAALFVSAVFLPFLVGLIAGINVAFVGSTFPLLLGILPALGLQAQTIPYLVLATFSGFTGVMVSPIHICYVLTCRYFHTDLGRPWRRLLLPCSLLLACGGAWFWLLSRHFA